MLGDCRGCEGGIRGFLVITWRTCLVSCTGRQAVKTRGPGRAMEGKEHFPERFLRPRMAYRQPDGGEWGGQDLENATRGAVTRSYVANFKKAS